MDRISLTKKLRFSSEALAGFASMYSKGQRVNRPTIGQYGPGPGITVSLNALLRL